MPAVADLDVPALEYMDPTLKGPRFAEALRELSERTWIARADPFGWFVLDHEAAAFFMRTKDGDVPGADDLRGAGDHLGAAVRAAVKGNLLDLDGEDHRRLRKAVQHAFTPKAADALPARDARAARRALRRRRRRRGAATPSARSPSRTRRG